MSISFEKLASPILLRGDDRTAYRDPAVCYRDGRFYLFFTLVETEPDGGVYLYLATTESEDLRHFSPVRKLTVRDRSKNFSSPGNIVFFHGEYHLCCQTYCRENGEKYGNANSRIYRMSSPDLVCWSEPRLLRVKGDAVPPRGDGTDDRPLFHRRLRHARGVVVFLQAERRLLLPVARPGALGVRRTHQLRRKHLRFA